MRLALLIVGCCSIGAAGPGRPQVPTLVAESSFITRLADEAINADGPDAIANRDQSRSAFVNAFLMGYANPGSTIPVNEGFTSRGSMVVGGVLVKHIEERIPSRLQRSCASTTTESSKGADLGPLVSRQEALSQTLRRWILMAVHENAVGISHLCARQN
jgi:hypothetical protein